MAKDKEPKTPSEFLDRLSEFLMDRPEETLDELRGRLRNQGVDPDRMVERVRQLVDARSKEFRLAWQEKARRERLAAAERLKDVGVRGPQTRNQLIERIRTLLSDPGGLRPAVAQAYFRNFEQMTENDLRGILEDFERAVQLGQDLGQDKEGA